MTNQHKPNVNTVNSHLENNTHLNILTLNNNKRKIDPNQAKYFNNYHIILLQEPYIHKPELTYNQDLK